MSANASCTHRLSLSVVVLTRNRLSLLRRCLGSLERYATAAEEIVVIDNGSHDGSQGMVRREHPEFRLIENDENLGIAARNIGYRAARGDIILSLDDDIELVDANTVSKLLDILESNPWTAAVTMKLCEEPTGDDFPDHHWWHPRDRKMFQDQEFETDRINEAAVAFRREALEKVGYYYEELFWGGEEWDLVLGLIDSGYSVRYAPIPVKHLAPRGSLNSKVDFRHALLVRNRFWIALRRLGPVEASAFIVPRLFLWFWRAIRFGYLRHYLRGLWDLLGRLPTILQDRQPISKRTKRRLRSMRARGRQGQGGLR